MERLTKRTANGKVAYALLQAGECVDPIDLLRVWGDRLAAYEDTGLEPEEVNHVLNAYGRGMTLRTNAGERLEIIKDLQTERLKELAQAEKDGRLVALPCKAGNAVWTESPIKGMVYSFEAPDIAWIIESADQFGKTVFLTREEAEAALKKREDAEDEAD